MPTEILAAIVDLAGSESLPALRLTNKRLRAVSDTPFAITHFRERRHVQSSYSMDALVEITAHPFFGKFVKTVIISGSRPEFLGDSASESVSPACVQCTQKGSSAICENPAPRHSALRFEVLRDKLDEAFSNIKRHSSSVYVGTRDGTRMCYGSTYYHGEHNEICETNRIYIPTPIGCKHLIKTWETILGSVHRSGCQIDGIKLYTYGRLCAANTPETETKSLIRHVLRSLSNKCSFELSLATYHVDHPHYYLRYDHNKRELDLQTLEFGSDYMPWESPDEEVRPMLRRLLTRSMAKITLDHCYFGNPDVLEILCKPKLEALTLRNVFLYTEHFDENLWSTFLHQLSCTTHLKYLEMSGLQYEFNQIYRGNEQSWTTWFQLPSGEQFQADPDMKWMHNLRLAPLQDGKETTILSDPNSISVQLRALAAQVAQMEVDKIAEIERDGMVRNDIVGLVKGTESDDSGNVDIQGVQSAEISNPHDEHGENDNNNEHGTNDYHNEIAGAH